MEPPIDTVSYPSPNFDARPPGTRINAIVLHSGEGTRASDLQTLTTPGSKKSAHYYVDRSGHIYQLVRPDYRAWHAGASSYLGRIGWNDFSVGIETEHREGQDWPAAQCRALADLCRFLITRYHVPQEYIAAHRWLAPERKADPTNWTSESLQAWIADLYVVDPLKARQIAGPPGQRSYFCSTQMLDFYTFHGAFGLFGYALSDETRDDEATYMRWERAIGKTSARYGAELALLSEAKARGWLG